ncbi:MAG: DUF177 domain-containing protein [Bacteroidetes bacterium]|nr:DUF177 domain-containing protein [Bacteroidota bacterium]
MSASFQIELPKLKLGPNAFDFELDTAFFEDSDAIAGATVKVRVLLEKTDRLLDARFDFQGLLTLGCDRCLQPYAQSLSLSHRIVYTFDEGLKDLEDAEIVFVTRNMHYLDLSQDFYDLVSLQVPYRKAPCEQPGFGCLADDKVKALLAEAQEVAEAAIEPQDETVPKTDPRWEALKKLRDTEEE